MYRYISYHNTKMDLTRVIARYRYRILELYEPLRRENITLTNNNLAKIFEYYCCIRLMEERNEKYEVYEDISVDFKNSRNLCKQDTGIDYISGDRNTYGQAKLRKTSLRWGEVSTFLAHLYCCSQQGNTIEGILSYNEGIQFSDQLNLVRNTLTEKPYNKDEMIQYCNELLANKEAIYSQIKQNAEYEVREYQTEAISLIKDNPNENIIIHLPTGSGKTVIMSRSIEPGKKYLILVPRIILLEQTRDVILSVLSDYRDKITLVGDGNANGNISYAYNSDHMITICVYNSIDLILGDIDNFDRIYIDEAHHIMKPALYQDFDMEDNQSDTISEGSGADNETYIEKIYRLRETGKCVYFSATIDRVDDMLYYGKSIRWMIDNGYLCDYSIQLPVFNQTDEREICKYLVNNYRHYIIYCNDRENGLRVTNYLNEILPNSAGFIDCNTSKNERHIMIEKYNSGELSYLVNIRILTEGFNAPITEGVCMLHIPGSKIMISQVLGRALRKYGGKKNATIMFPITEEEECKSVAKVLKILTDNDEKYQRMFSNKTYSGMLERKIVTSEDNEITDDCDIEMDTIAKHLYDIAFDSLGEVISGIDAFIYKLNMVKEFIDENNKRPNSHSKNNEEKILGKWLVNQQLNYKSNKYIMKNTDIRKHWEDFVNNEKYIQYFMNNDDVWIDTLNKVKEFIDENNRRPSSNSKNKKEEMIGRWLGNQITNYKSKKYIMKNAEIRKLWEDFVNDEKYRQYFISRYDKWIETLNKVKEFINENNRKPNSHSKNKKEKTLGMWLVDQNKNYKSKKYMMKNLDVRKLWEDFISDEKYRQYFMSNDDIWIKTFNKVKKFIDENNRRPNSNSKNKREKILGKWVGTQITNYKSNEFIISSNVEVRKLWKDFVNDEKYNQYFMSINDKWIEMLNKVKEFIGENNRRPKSNSKNKKEKILGIWLGTQTANHKSNRYIMKNPDIRRIWEDFVNDEKYRQYFMSYEQIWEYKFEKVKEFLTREQRRPNARSQDENESTLGHWLQTQNKNYRKQRDRMKYASYRQKWEEFIMSDEYSKFFN
jgi:superfamily II DNA/RNA helicase